MEEKIPSNNGRTVKFYLYKSHEEIINKISNEQDLKPSESLRLVLENYDSILKVIKKEDSVKH